MILKEQNIIHKNGNQLNDFDIQFAGVYGWMAEWLCSGLQSR